MAEAAKFTMEEGTVPTTPTTNHWSAYFKTDGAYQVDDAGAETALATDATSVDAAGAVMETDYGAQTVLAATSNNTPVALTVAASRIVGRTSGGNIDALTATEVRTILNVEDGADVTDTANVGSAVDTLRTPEDVTGDNAITAAELVGGKNFTNIGASGVTTATLPGDAATGAVAVFMVCAAFELRVVPTAGDALYYSGGLMADAEYISSSDVGSRLEAIRLSDGNWFCHTSGTWTEETP